MSLESYDIDIEYSVPDYEESCYNYDLDLVKNNSYMILREDQLLKERESVISEAMEHLFLERDDAILALIHFSWSMDRLKDDWYNDVDLSKVRCGIELSEGNKQNLMKKGVKGGNKECLVCFAPKDETFSALKCGHNFCGDCWKDYLTVKADDVLVCLSTPCPQSGCQLIVPEALFMKYIESKEVRERFNKSVLRNFTGYNSDIRICPGITCNICIKCDSYASKEIVCSCGTVFCFKCGKESHRPCSCEIIEKWEYRSKSDTDNDKWLKANTKTCPHCKQRIEKSQGCNYMHCNKSAGGCGNAFCYVCEVDWAKHSQDHFKCNMYTPEIKEKEDEATQLKAELARYKFYFDRFMNYTQAIRFADKLYPKLDTLIDSMINIKLLPLAELEFLKEALRTVISAKRTLKYTYIFGYYLKDGNEKKLFEYSQSFLERNADNLHQLIEQDSLMKIIAEENFEQFNKQFTDFKNNVVNLCFATTKYQKNLMNEIETSMIHLLDDKLLNVK